MTNPMTNYETVLLIRQDRSPQQVETILEKYLDFIKTHKGKVVRQEIWGLRNLAYPIKKNSRAHYLCFNYQLASTDKNELERQLRLNEEVLRYLTISTVDLPKEPSPMMQKTDDAEQEQPMAGGAVAGMGTMPGLNAMGGTFRPRSQSGGRKAPVKRN